LPRHRRGIWKFSPRAWGWTADYDRIYDKPGSFPHARGGGPTANRRATAARRFSPRAWGWTAFVPLNLVAILVFPTRVGVDRESRRRSGYLLWVFPTRVGVDRMPLPEVYAAIRFPHARGGGPRW